jgi:O-antigen/teichoic acid export membrane protein
LISLVFPACVGIALAARPLAAVMVGPEFRDGVAHLLPIVSAAALLRGVAVHFLEHAFHLSRRSDHLLAIYVPITILNIVLNYMLLPRFGMISAAWVAVFSQLAIALADYHVGRRSFSFAFPFEDALKCALATGGMALALRFVVVGESWAGLGTMVAIGVTTYAVLALALDFAGLRQLLFRRS